MEVIFNVVTLFFGGLFGAMIGIVVLGILVVLWIKGHAIVLGAAILTKTVKNLAEETVPWLPQRWQDAIESRRPRKTVEGEAFPVPDSAQRLPSPHTPRTSGPTQGGNPMRRDPGTPRNGPQVYDTAADTPTPSRFNLDGIRQWAHESPAMATVIAVILASLVLNPIFLGMTILREPILFIWMELLGALALGGLVHLNLRLHKLADRQPHGMQTADADFLTALQRVLGEDEDQIRRTLASSRSSIELDRSDQGILDAVRNKMSDEEFGQFLEELIEQYEATVRPFVRNPNPRRPSFTRRMPRRVDPA